MQVRIFADCAGRMLALRDHLSLFGGDGVARAEAARRAHLSILDALLEASDEESLDGARAKHWRIDARAAQTDILSQAAFGTSPVARRRAAAASERHIARCNKLILGA